MQAEFRDSQSAFTQHIDPLLLAEALAVKFGLDMKTIRNFGVSEENDNGIVKIELQLELNITQLELNKIYDECWKEAR